MSSQNDWLDDCPVQDADPLQEDRSLPTLPVGSSLRSCSGSDIYLSKTASRATKKSHLLLFPGVVAPKKSDKKASNDKGDDGETLVKGATRLGLVEGLHGDAPTVHLGTSLQLSGTHINTTSKFLVLTINPRKQHVQCKNVFTKVLVLGNARGRDDSDEENSIGESPPLPHWGGSARTLDGSRHQAKKSRVSLTQDDSDDLDLAVVEAFPSTRPRRPRKSYDQPDTDVEESSEEDKEELAKPRARRTSNPARKSTQDSSDEEVSEDELSDDDDDFFFEAESPVVIKPRASQSRASLSRKTPPPKKGPPPQKPVKDNDSSDVVIPDDSGDVSLEMVATKYAKRASAASRKLSASKAAPTKKQSTANQKKTRTEAHNDSDAKIDLDDSDNDGSFEVSLDNPVKLESPFKRANIGNRKSKPETSRPPALKKKVEDESDVEVIDSDYSFEASVNSPVKQRSAPKRADGKKRPPAKKAKAKKEDSESSDEEVLLEESDDDDSFEASFDSPVKPRSASKRFSNGRVKKTGFGVLKDLCDDDMSDKSTEDKKVPPPRTNSLKPSKSNSKKLAVAKRPSKNQSTPLSSESASSPKKRKVLSTPPATRKTESRSVESSAGSQPRRRKLTSPGKKKKAAVDLTRDNDFSFL